MPNILHLYSFTISHTHLSRDELSCALREHAHTINGQVRKLYQHHTNTKPHLQNLQCRWYCTLGIKTEEVIYLTISPRQTQRPAGGGVATDKAENNSPGNRLFHTSDLLYTNCNMLNAKISKLCCTEAAKPSASNFYTQRE